MMDNMGNDENNMDTDMNGNNNEMGMTNNNDGYTASRTDAANTGTINPNTTFIWIILAIATAIIVALVWYYATQSNESNTNNR